MNFSRDEALHVLRPRLWNFVRSNALLATAGKFVENVWDLPSGRFDELVATHVGLLDLTGEALAACEAALPRLPSSVGRRFDEYDGVVHGPVDWPKTQDRRIATATPTLYVCRPVERRYDTPAARLVHATLVAISQLATRSGRRATQADGHSEESVPTTVSALLYDRSDSARLHLRHPKLRELRRARPPRGDVLSRLLSRRPELVTAAAFLEVHDRAFSGTDEVTLRAVLSEHLLAPAASDDLFELIVLFDLVSAFTELGFAEVPSSPTLWGDGEDLAPLATLWRTDLGRLDLFWDRSLWAIFPKARLTSCKRHIEEAAGMAVAPIRPDVTLVFRDVKAVFLIEAKVTSTLGAAAERRGIIEAMAYLKDAEAFLSGSARPRAGVVAWNATGRPPEISIPYDAVPDVVVGSQGDLKPIAMWALAAAKMASSSNH